MARNKTSEMTWAVTAAVATLVAGVVADRAIAAGWRAITGKTAPTADDLLDYRLTEVVAFAVVSGATLNLMRDLSLRQVAKWQHRPRAIEA